MEELIMKDLILVVLAIGATVAFHTGNLVLFNWMFLPLAVMVGSDLLNHLEAKLNIHYDKQSRSQKSNN